MEGIKLQRHSSALMKRAPIYFTLCAVLFLVSLWFAPYSTTYLLGTVFIALSYTNLTIIYWKKASSLLFVAIIVLITQGENLIREIAFTEARISSVGWMLLIEYLSLVFAIFFGALIILSAKIKQYLNTGSEVDV